MVSTVLDIYNAALSACHAKGRVSSLTENSREREECDIWYDLVLETVQEAAWWPSSKATERLALLTTRDTNAAWVATDPLPQYNYKYSLPTGYLRAWHLTDFTQFELGYDATREKTVLHSNTPNASLTYARKQELVGTWTPGQRNATIYGLAGHIAGALTGRGEIVQKNFNLANQLLADAQAASMPVGQQQLQFIPSVLQGRGYSDFSHTEVRYYYPMGGLFSAGATPA